jgi:hypothetical protein
MLEAIGDPPPAKLGPARLELHWALQVPAAAAQALIAPVPDDSHTSFEWLASRQLLAGVRTPAGLRAALRPAHLTLLALGEDDAPVAKTSLAGGTLDEGFRWMKQALRAPADVTLGLPDHDLPDHPVRHGGRFTGDRTSAGRTELARWYAAADGVLRALASRTPGASPVRCWPHHFDIGTVLPPGIGVGFSPGDASYAEPYFYVTPGTPQPNPSPPPLPAGARWHHEGWFGAVLTGTALVAVAPSARDPLVARFIDSSTSSA